MQESEKVTCGIGPSGADMVDDAEGSTNQISTRGEKLVKEGLTQMESILKKKNDFKFHFENYSSKVKSRSRYFKFKRIYISKVCTL